MAKLNFEKNLPHQQKAVESVVDVFKGMERLSFESVDKHHKNILLRGNQEYKRNIKKIQIDNSIDQTPTFSNIIDIMMETGTGKTYTYTKTIFELNKQYGIFKFIIVVPTLPIKAGTISFLKSPEVIEHFKEQYNKTINLHILESKKNNKNKKSFMPSSIMDFAKAGDFEKNKIQVLITNAGMINSKTMTTTFDNIFFNSSIPFDILKETNPFLIIDEPHKFDTKNTTWKNILKLNPQFIIRYGATFPQKEIVRKNIFKEKEKIKIIDYQNLIYTLNAVEAFNNNLVKGVIGYITEFEAGKNIIVKFVNSDGKEATFELIDNKNKKIFKLIKMASLEKIHPAMKDLFIEKLNKTTILLSNGLELKKGDKINPFAYSQTIQEIMIKKAIKHHFELEKEYLTKEVKIKPLTLFFIDNISEYRDENGYIKKLTETFIKAEIEELLKTETDEYYKNYLKKSLQNISQTHGGYFAQDKKESDEVIEKEINEILHDKLSLLDIDNPRRFIFSKWTLKEGWDNPNIFQICKLRGSGSEISKLQEVGRGLRLPVNQYGNRIKGKQFYLNYFVDWTENDFVEQLVNEINKKSNKLVIDENNPPVKLNEDLIKRICENYNLDEETLLETLDNENVIKRNNDFKENGYEYIKKHYPLIFEDNLKGNKVKKSTQKDTKKIKIRVEKYKELKELWEKLNEKVILEYKIKNEEEFEKLFLDFLNSYTPFKDEKIQEKKQKIEIQEKEALLQENISISDVDITSISTMRYDDFLKELSKTLYINLITLHKCFLQKKEINNYLNQSTIRLMKEKFNNYLMSCALSKFEIEYKKITNSIHPTKLTDKNGKVKKEINSSDIGVEYSSEKVANNYLFDELFFDSDLEKENIKTNIDEVIVFTKIPKNSIKIPIAGGKSYSPDFAYVINYKNGEKKLNFIVETKNLDEYALRNEEVAKIKHAQKFFDNNIEIKFKTQFSNQKIIELIKEICKI